MWKCIRCEKENKDTEEICTECGHGRTMDYVQYRTLAKISAKLAKNWKISRNTEKDPEKEKNAEEFIQKKLSDLRSSVTSMKNEISKEQNEINALYAVVEARNKQIEKNKKIGDKVDSICGKLTWLLAVLITVFAVYEIAFVENTGIEYIKENLISAVLCTITTLIGSLLGCGLVIGISGVIIIAVVNVIRSAARTEIERDNAQKSLDEKKNKINSIQSNVARLEYQIQRSENDREQIKNKLSMVSPEKMNEEFERWTR